MKKKNIDVILVTGSIHSGKTTFINKYIENLYNNPDCPIDLKSTDLLILENGNIKPEFKHETYTARTRRSNASWLDEWISKLEYNDISTVIIEWNGMEKISGLMSEINKKLNINILHSFFLQSSSQMNLWESECSPFLDSQIKEADTIIFTSSTEKNENVTSKKDSLKFLQKKNRFTTLLEGFPDSDDEWQTLIRSSIGSNFYGKNSIWMAFVVGFIALGFAFFLYNDGSKVWNDFILITLGMLIQSLPFLILGVIISATIQVFIPQEKLIGFFGKSLPKQIVTPLVISIFLPVCDCASVPVFRSLLQKKIPTLSAVIFLLVGPILNPIALSSTIFSFGIGKILMLRVSLGIIISLIVGLSFNRYRINNLFISTASYSDEMPKNKAYQLLNVSLNEFKSVFQYLLIGSLVCSVLQLMLRTVPINMNGAFSLVAIFGMMLLAFLLSLCSSSDSVIARSLSKYVPPAATMGFLVYGPMIDYKNLLLMSHYFKKSFIIELTMRTTILTYIVLVIYHITTVLI